MKLRKKISNSLKGKNVGKVHNKEKEEKRFETMKQNGTMNKSGTEDKYYEYLCDKFGADDIIRHYKEERYPFNCDFYIKSLDKFIEYNEHWTHGFQPFDSSNYEHLSIVQEWESKNSDYYNQAIKTWTVRDVKKLKTFRKNNLNFEIIYRKGLVINH